MKRAMLLVGIMFAMYAHLAPAQTVEQDTPAAVAGLDTSATVRSGQSLDASKPKAASGTMTAQAATVAEQIPWPGFGAGATESPTVSQKDEGPLSPVRRYLADRGIEVGIAFNDLLLKSQAGRLPYSSANYGSIEYHLSADLDRIIGLPDTHFNFTINQFVLGHNDGTFATMMNTPFTPAIVINTDTMLTQLSLESKFLDRRLDVEVGRLSPGRYFLLSSFCGFCFAATQAVTVGMPGLTAGVWGGRMAYTLGNDDRIQFALTESDRYVFQETNGWHFSTSHADGYIALANYLHESTFRDTRYPLKLELGLYRNSAAFDDPVYNTDGSSSVFNSQGSPVVHHEGRNGFYGQVRQVVWTAAGNAGDNPNPENVALYGGAFITPGVAQSYPVEAFAGAEWSGFVRSNPFLTVGAGLRYMLIGERRALYWQQWRVKLGGPNEATRRNMFEPDIHAQIPLGRSVILHPFAAYIFNPVNYQYPTATRQRNGWFIGVDLTIDIGGALGLGYSPPPM